MPSLQDREVLEVKTDLDLVKVRQKVREHAARVKLALVPQTKLVTAASELARNMIDYAGGGEMRIQAFRREGQKGLRIQFEDHGPGIENIELAMKDGYSTGQGMGLGLPGAKRLVNDFSITSEQGKGTCVTICMWS
ncbi:MAG: anti-sigma regulatory factor [Calditrichaeota bacterium]|nr:MAG: anti-sigma regulatory factor [Calditrichota bacterium]